MGWDDVTHYVGDGCQPPHPEPGRPGSPLSHVPDDSEVTVGAEHIRAAVQRRAVRTPDDDLRHRMARTIRDAYVASTCGGLPDSAGSVEDWLEEADAALAEVREANLETAGGEPVRDIVDLAAPPGTFGDGHTEAFDAAIRSCRGGQPVGRDELVDMVNVVTNRVHAEIVVCYLLDQQGLDFHREPQGGHG
jgi:hypothetical protein